MKIEYVIESNEPKVLVDGEWNALSMFLETESSNPHVRNHIGLKKKRKWMGNASTLCLISGSLFEVSTNLDLELENIEIHSKKLLELMSAWCDFENNRKPNVIHV